MKVLNSAFCVLLLVALTSCAGGPEPTPPEEPDSEYSELIIIDNGLGADTDREDFYHTPEGSEVFPLLWANELESSVTGRPFLENMERFGLIRDDSGRGTGYIGLTSGPRKGVGVEMVGVNCAACHVGQIQFGDTAVRIDGAPNTFDMFGFAKELAESVQATVTSPTKLLTFLRKVHEQHPLELSHMETVIGEFLATDAPDTHISDDEADDVGEDLTSIAQLRRKVRLGLSYVELLKSMAGLQNPDDTVAGPGRADAFGTARTVFFKGTEPMTAPTSYPFIWNFEHTAWFHWNTNTNSVLERNIGQSLGLGASFDPRTCETSIRFDNLRMMEELGYKLTAPAWPEEVLGAIDRDLASRGEEVYKSTCTQCHDNYTISDDDLALADYHILSTTAVGTDPREADNVLPPVQLNVNVCKDVPEEAIEQMTFAQGHTLLLGAIRDTFFRTNNIPADEQAAWGGGRTRGDWRDSAADMPDGAVYPAKPLVGIWATPPYLHNGSVPNIRALLALPADRPTSFKIGHRIYDPVNLGYTVDEATAPATFDTTITGNSNAGHFYGTQLSDDDKSALIEYLKSLTEADRALLHQDFVDSRNQ